MLAVSFPRSKPDTLRLTGVKPLSVSFMDCNVFFTHIGFVPHSQVFDNGAGVGHKSASGVVESELFARGVSICLCMGWSCLVVMFGGHEIRDCHRFEAVRFSSVLFERMDQCQQNMTSRFRTVGTHRF